MTTYKEFLGLNYCIYEPILDDIGAEGGNTLGYSFLEPYIYSDAIGTNPHISLLTRHDSSKTMVLLNLHRNGPYGYPMWKQIRTSENPISRRLRKENEFNYLNQSNTITRLTEPVVSENYPISLIGEVSVYNEDLGIFEKKPVEIKTAFNNETTFFVNNQANEHFSTILETDDNYEALKEMYLDGGLEDEGSMLDAFSLLTYRQTIWPKQQYAYLDQTRSRTFYVNTFWRDAREDRTQTDVDNGFGAIVPSQSMWNLDAREDFATRTAPASFVPVANYISFPFDLGGFNHDNSDSGPGILQNRYCTFTTGSYYMNVPIVGEPKLLHSTGWPPPSSYSISSNITASIEYSRLHTLKNVLSPANPSGPRLTNSELYGERVSGLSNNYGFMSMPTASIFNGRAAWDAAAQANKAPFYDSYEDFAEETRIKGKSFSKIPEFRISNHVEFYLGNSAIEELPDIFELSGGLSQDTVSSDSNFYKILSNSDFLKHFDLIRSDHKDFSKESIITLRCKAIKKFLPYEGFYPADRTVDLAKQFYNSYKNNISINLEDSLSFTDFDEYDQFAFKPLLTPMFAPGVLFNAIKSGMAVDFPIILVDDIYSNATTPELNTFEFFDDHEQHTTAGPFTPWYGNLGDRNNALMGHSQRSRQFNSFRSNYSTRIPFEALVEPSAYLAGQGLALQEPHPFGFSDLEFEAKWDGGGDPLYTKMMSNFLAEVPEFFIDNQNFKTISSLEEQSPEFGNAVSGNYYLMRLKMTKSRNKTNLMLGGYGGFPVMPPQDVVDQSGSYSLDEKFTTRETITMYSRPTAFGPPTYGDGGWKKFSGIDMRMGSSWGYNFPYTPPYYHGEAWCDLIFECDETRKWTVEEILGKVKEYPYYTRYWNPMFQDAIRDLTGYSSDVSASYDPTNPWDPVAGTSVYSGYDESPWNYLIKSASVINSVQVGPYGIDLGSGGSWLDKSDLETSTDFLYASPLSSDNWTQTGPQSPVHLNNNAMQLNSSVNIFGKGIVRTKDLQGDGSNSRIEVASGDTVRGKTRWIIQSKFETPILNFNKYNDLSDPSLKCTEPQFAKSQVPRGMWHQYGDLPSENEGIYLQVSDIPDSWLRGALGIQRSNPKIKSLADLVGFPKEPVRLGEVADVKEISEAVVAVPFIEKDGTRKFFSIPRDDIDSCIGATKREVEEGTFVLGGPPKAGDSVYQMVKKMQKYVFPPSMDFVKYEEIDPFVMYVFEFKHNLSKQDLADIWQNLPPEIGTRMEEAEATISHELLAHELLGGGAVVKNGTLDDNAEGNGIPSNIQWMIFKAKKRAKTNYFDKVVAKKGTTEDTSSQQLENAQGQTGDDLGVTYNWPYDFFSLVELVKIDAEVSFANIENDDKGQKSIKKVESKKTRDPSMINKARGKGRIE